MAGPDGNAGNVLCLEMLENLVSKLLRLPQLPKDAASQNRLVQMLQ